MDCRVAVVAVVLADLGDHPVGTDPQGFFQAVADFFRCATVKLRLARGAQIWKNANETLCVCRIEFVDDGWILRSNIDQTLTPKIKTG